MKYISEKLSGNISINKNCGTNKIDIVFCVSLVILL